MNSSEWSDFDGLYGIHPWRKLLGDLIEEMTADVFESMRIYTKQDIPRATWAETDVTGSYTQLSGADFALKVHVLIDTTRLALRNVQILMG